MQPLLQSSKLRPSPFFTSSRLSAFEPVGASLGVELCSVGQEAGSWLGSDRLFPQTRAPRVSGRYQG
jgi:hypothetical protein